MKLISVFSKLPEDPKGLEDLVMNAKPEQLLGLLVGVADFLYYNLGTLAHWQAVAKDINRAHIGVPGNTIMSAEVKAYVEPIWEAQKKLRLLHYALFNTKAEKKIFGIYKLLAKDENSMGFSIFYDQLNNGTGHIGNLSYGHNKAVEGGKVLSYEDYAQSVLWLRYLVTLGAFDWRAIKLHEGVSAKAITEAGQPVGRPSRESGTSDFSYR
ncbi:MAG: hypothetical protein HY438_01480 [DPANN group archaeon]|nr:hypothetical protein [DPANN group archaeon]